MLPRWEYAENRLLLRFVESKSCPFGESQSLEQWELWTVGCPAIEHRAEQLQLCRTLKSSS